MVKAALLLTLGAVAGTNAFMAQPSAPRTATSLNGGASGFATSLDGKKVKVSRVQELLDTSQMVFAVPANSITVAEAQVLRRSMPEGSTLSVVKNTIMARAVQGTEYEATTSMLKGANMWFFIEDDIGASIKAWKSFVKESGKQEFEGKNIAIHANGKGSSARL